MGWDGMGWMDLCVGLFYEHRFAMLINDKRKFCLLSIFCTFPELPSNIYGYICASGVFPGHAFSCMDTSSASVANPQIQDLKRKF